MTTQLGPLAILLMLALLGSVLIPWSASGRWRGPLVFAISSSGLVAVLSGGRAVPLFLGSIGWSLCLIGVPALLRAAGSSAFSATLSLLAWWTLLASPFLAALVTRLGATEAALPAWTELVAAMHPAGMLLDAGWGTDWFRSNRLYQLAPLGSYAFRYPTVAWQGGIVASLGLIGLLLGRLATRRDRPKEAASE
ncbi:MAG: hypothetical protein RL885_08205 [Planctomycetota bacterium]